MLDQPNGLQKWNDKLLVLTHIKVNKNKKVKVHSYLEAFHLFPSTYDSEDLAKHLF